MMKESLPTTRREMLRLSAGSLLALGAWPGALRAEGQRDSGDFHFIAVNDLHYHTELCGPWLERVIRQMRSHDEQIDFCLLVGDLAEDGKPGELGSVKDHLEMLGVPVYVVVGNHDYQSQTDRRVYEELFPGRLNYQFEHSGWRFIGLDTSDGVKYRDTAIQPATFRWLDDKLPKLDKQQPTVLFTHFPMGPEVNMRPTNAEELLDRFREFNLQAVFCGHFHGFTERQVGEATLTTNRCCAISKGNHDDTTEKGYFLCHATDGKASRRFVEVKPG